LFEISSKQGFRDRNAPEAICISFINTYGYPDCGSPMIGQAIMLRWIGLTNASDFYE